MTDDIRRRNGAVLEPAAPPSDGGPPVDTESPFLDDRARSARAAAQRPLPKSRRRKLLSWLVTFTMLAAAVFAGIWLTGYRLANAADVALGRATLTAVTVSVPSPGDGQIVRLYAHRSQTVRRGKELARVRVFGTDRTGQATTRATAVRAPLTGVVSTLLPRGNAVTRGGALAEIYDPTAQTLQTTVSASTASDLRKGMHVRLTGPGIRGFIPAYVDRIVAPSPADLPPGMLRLVLRPKYAADVRRLPPGLQLDAVVNTNTGLRRGPTVLESGS